MTTFKVYFMLNGKLDNCFIEARDSTQMRWKLLSRFNHANLMSYTEVL